MSLRTTMTTPQHRITGRASRGEETPRFEAKLFDGTILLAKIQSDGQGGQARVQWTEDAMRGGVARTSAVAWLASEAKRLYPDGAADGWLSERLLANAEETSLLVVPEHLRRRR